MNATRTTPRRRAPARIPLVSLLTVVSLTGAACTPDPELGPELQEVGESLHDAGRGLADAMCSLGKGFAEGKQRRVYERRCPARADRRR